MQTSPHLALKQCASFPLSRIIFGLLNYVTDCLDVMKHTALLLCTSVLLAGQACTALLFLASSFFKLRFCCCRTGWSALYDDSSDEEAPHGLHAEQSQASSLSFQPHNLFEEHFATAAAPPTPCADSFSALGTPACKLPAPRQQVHHRQYEEPSSTAQQQQENQGSESPATGNAHSCKVRRPWGASTEAEVGQELQSNEPLMNSPAALQSPKGTKAGGQGRTGAASCEPSAAQRGASQSPMGKPPLPTARRLNAKGANRSFSQQKHLPNLFYGCFVPLIP